MKPTRFYFRLTALLVVATFSSLLSSQSEAALLHPGDLNPGDEYRYAFVTSTTRDATSTNIADYDSFVNTAAAGSTFMGVPDLTWRVIGSTMSVNAIDHLVDTSGGWSSNSVPIYLLNGTSRVANDFNDLWDGSIGAGINLSETGVEFNSTGGIVFTGTESNGLGFPDRQLGSTLFTTLKSGTPDATNSNWINSDGALSKVVSSYFYAISDVIVVGGAESSVPEPSALLLGLLCFALMTFLRARQLTARHSR